MTAADEYQRVLAEHDLDPMPPRKAGLGRWLWRCICGDDLESPAEHRAHVAQALAADPGVRAAVEREARAEVDREAFCFNLGPHLADAMEALGIEDADFSDGRALADVVYCLGYRQEPSDG